jgi:hypothetical protein
LSMSSMALATARAPLPLEMAQGPR